MKSADIYEGKCRYCGETEIMMAESQKEADQITSENCDCGGYEEELRHDNRPPVHNHTTCKNVINGELEE